MPAATSIDRPQETASDGQVVILQKGNPVAALCRVEEGTLQRDWILATIVAYDPHTDSYEVEDVELSETGEIVMGSAPPAAGRRSTSGTPPPPPHGARRSTVAARRGASRFLAQRQGVRALSPTYEEALVATASVRIKERVLALFPGTTCLYPATVVNVPSRVRAHPVSPASCRHRRPSALDTNRQCCRARVETQNGRICRHLQG